VTVTGLLVVEQSAALPSDTDRPAKMLKIRAKPRVVVASSERHHSYQLAMALWEAGLLSLYVHGSPLPSEAERLGTAAMTFALPISPILRRAAACLGSSPLVKTAYHFGAAVFDSLVSKMISHWTCDAVVGYEVSSATIFETAKKRGMLCILDAASLHHQTQDARGPYIESERVHRWIACRKDREIELADVIIACSNLARQSYIDAGVPAPKVHACLLGVNTEQFQTGPAQDRDSGQPVRFAFVGHCCSSKGFDVLLQAATLLEKKWNLPFEIEVAGSGLSGRRLDLSSVHVHGRLPHDQIPAFLKASDCLVHPSLFDSFGLVVAEALSAGVPVIISDSVGAKEIVRPGQTGWVVPTGNVQALAERMRWCIEHRDALRLAGDIAMKRERLLDWSSYRVRVAELVGALLEERGLVDGDRQSR